MWCRHFSWHLQQPQIRTRKINNIIFKCRTFADEVERNCCFSTPGRNWFTDRQELQGFPDTKKYPSTKQQSKVPVGSWDMICEQRLIENYIHEPVRFGSARVYLNNLVITLTDSHVIDSSRFSRHVTLYKSIGEQGHWRQLLFSHRPLLLSPSSNCLEATFVKMRGDYKSNSEELFAPIRSSVCVATLDNVSKPSRTKALNSTSSDWQIFVPGCKPQEQQQQHHHHQVRKFIVVLE